MLMGDLELLDSLSRATVGLALWNIYNTWIILTDFDATVICFREAFPFSAISKSNGTGSNDEIRSAVRCLAAVVHVLLVDMFEAIDLLAESMPRHEKMDELLCYFKHSCLRWKARSFNLGKLCSRTVQDTYAEPVLISHRRNNSYYQCHGWLSLWSSDSIYV
ncbi:hypothetical protein RF11_09516 [Thelohanellus kitauei]|uniref:Uncharacterized protein n=1 Tax=Thelohanellus kitauei TaxID=669202 RepID=A0A0C2MMT6_THEKT|nr:hypothetical protein RF11_09516 [Thelohanellus kitauei]